MHKRPSLLIPSVLVLALTASGCKATGRTANAYFDWGGRVFTTNPVSVAPYFLGFAAFFVAGLPLDLFSWIATAFGWPEGRGEDYQGSALAPSIFMGTTGGMILAAPFWPFGLPWWDPDREDTEAKPQAAPAKPDARPTKDPADPGEIPAGAPRR